MATKTRLGLIGGNKQGQEHLRAALAPESQVQFVAVLDQNPLVLNQVSQISPSSKLYSDLTEFLSNNEIQGLVLALPHFVYPDLLSVLVQRGLPVLKEKPLGRSFAEGLQYEHLYAEHQTLLRTALQRRHHPSYCYVREILQDVEIQSLSTGMHLGFDLGTPDLTWRGDPVKSGGGALLDSGYHLVDLVQWLIGPFELVQSLITRNSFPCGRSEIDTEAVLYGKKNQIWLRIESKVGGTKKEWLRVQSSKGLIRANREGVWLDEHQLMVTDKAWLDAMTHQLNSFADQFQTKNWSVGDEIWEQGMAQKIIEQAYFNAELIRPSKGII